MPRDETTNEAGVSAEMMHRPPMGMGRPPIGPSGGGGEYEIEKLTDWLKSCFGRTHVRGLVLSTRSAVDAKDSDIDNWDGDDFDRYPEPDDMAGVIMEKAYKDASSQRGATRYIVKAYREGEDVHFSKHPFKLEGGLDRTDGDHADIPLNEQGFMALLIQHTQFATRMALSSTNDTVRQLSQQNAELTKHLNRLAGMQYSLLEMQQEMMDRKAERGLAVSEQEAKEKRKDKLFSELLMLAPFFVRKFMGGKDQGADTMLAEEQIDRLLESITPEQFPDLLGVFSDEQRMAFMAFYSEYGNRKKKKAEKSAEASAPAQETPPIEEAQQGTATVEPEPIVTPPPEEVSPQEAPPVDPLIEKMLVVLGNDLTDERVERLAQRLDETRRAAFLTAVEMHRARNPPPPPVDPFIEMMVDVLGDDLTDEKVNQLGETLEEGQRVAFLAAVETQRAARRAAQPLPVAAEAEAPKAEVQPEGSGQ